MKGFLLTVMVALVVPVFSQQIEPEYLHIPEPVPGLYPLEFSLHNPGTESISIWVMPQSEAIIIEDNRVILNPGESRIVPFTLNLHRERIPFQKNIILMGGGSRDLLPIYAGIDPPREEGGHSTQAFHEAESILEYYYSPECQSCLDMIEEELQKLSPELREKLVLRRWNILDDQALERLFLLYPQGLPDELPVLVINGIPVEGEPHIKEALAVYLEEFKDRHRYSRKTQFPLLFLGFLLGAAAIIVFLVFRSKRRNKGI